MMNLCSVRPPTAVVAVCGALVALAAVNVGGCVSEESEAVITPYPPPAKLVVITPHNSMIRELFAMGFSDWHHKHFDRFVDIQWIPMGTVECLEYINEVTAQDYETTGRAIPDVMFGGGITDHKTLIKRGQAKAIDVKDALVTIPGTILGLPTRDPEGNWHATALSGFGVLYNKKVCSQREIPEPTSWTDLAKPEYLGWVSLADPNRSGSNRQCLTLILQRYGWQKGWSTILRMAANSRALLRSSRDVIGDVRAGVSVAGLSVSFTALHEIEKVGADQLAYVSPPGGSAITPDSVTVLSCASTPKLAERFVRFCLDEEGQILWGVKAEERQGYRDTLYRYPILPKMYEAYRGKLGVIDNPFTMKRELALDLDKAMKQSQIIAPLLGAACGDNHILLQKCWKRIIDSGMPERPLAELTVPLFDEEVAYEVGAKYNAGDPKADALVQEWSKLFRTRYEKILSTLN